MIRKVVLKGFKRFDEVTFDLPGHVVLAGPNNTGKTTLLQAIAAWELGFRKWLEVNDFNPRSNGYPWKELERLEFSPVAVRSFDLLWKDRKPNTPFEIGVQVGDLPLVTLQFKFLSNGSILVRPEWRTDGNLLRDSRLKFRTTFIPAMSGLTRSEARLADQEAIDSALAQGRPGDVLRNLLFQASRDEESWRRLNGTMKKLFACELLPPRGGAELVCEYKQGLGADAPVFEVASAGSGFLQVLLLLALVATQRQDQNSRLRALLVDEPDAHLHMLLQRSIYSELRAMVAESQSQLFVSTHSEMIVNGVDSSEICLMFGRPRFLEAGAQSLLKTALETLSHSDILEAEGAAGVLYTEDFTDVEILKAFAEVLGDSQVLGLLSTQLVFKSIQAELPDGLGGTTTRKHWDVLRQIRPELRGLEVLDKDSRNGGDDNLTDAVDQMQRIRWRRYEIESYLVHPEALHRFIASKVGEASAASIAWDSVSALLRSELQDAFLADPGAQNRLVESYFANEKVSEVKDDKPLSGLIPRMIEAAGLRVPKRDYFQIAKCFKPEEVHPEIIERLGQICRAFGVADV